MENKFVFEEGMARLEEIVKALEKGDAQLDKSLALFEEGMKLIKDCGEALEKAENKIKLLTKAEGPEFMDFDSEER